MIGGKVAPSKERFRKVLDKLNSGESSARALTKLYGWSIEESIKMKWCLGEACQRKTAALLRSPGVALTVNQDARSHWLCVRFAGCNDNLEKTPRVGCLHRYAAVAELLCRTPRGGDRPRVFHLIEEAEV